jgi:putative endonuclease
MYIVYIVECHDGTYYTGITNRLDERLRQHQLGKASKYTRARLPVKLVFTESVPDRTVALQIEHQLKQLPRVKKVQLISTYNGEPSQLHRQ